jgi:hypothetical protein
MTNETNLNPEITTKPAGRVRRLAIAGALVVGAAGATFGITTATNVGAASAPAPAVFDTSGVANWAHSNGLSGLSPASVSTISAGAAAADLSGVAAWAEANGHSGLSPASLGATG